jgi:hypothetical protein
MGLSINFGNHMYMKQNAFRIRCDYPEVLEINTAYPISHIIPNHEPKSHCT